MTADEALAPVSGNGWLKDFVPYQIYRVSSLMNMRMQGRLRANGINLSQWRVLSVLRSAGCLSMTQIVEHSVMEQPTVSRVIAQFVDQGLVIRAVSAEDSRLSLVSLSSQGQALFDEIAPGAVRNQSAALEGLSVQELNVLRGALAKIEANISLDR